MSIIGKPILVDKMDAELAPKIAEAVIKDNERARKAKKRRKKKRRKRDDDRSICK